MKSDHEWQEECRWIDRAAMERGRIKSMNYDTTVFIRYCKMQRDSARRDGQFDAEQYIQHIINDLESAS